MGAGGAGGAGPTGPASASDASAQAGASAAAASTPAPDLAESLRQVGAAGKSSFEAAGDAAKAFRSLFFADVSLARSALGRTIAFAGLAIACGASAWLLLMATLIAFLRGAFGWAWTTSMLAGAASRSRRFSVASRADCGESGVGVRSASSPMPSRASWRRVALRRVCSK